MPGDKLGASLCLIRGSRYISSSSGPIHVDILALGIGVAGALWLDFECVSTEVVPLRLKQIGGKIFGAITIEEAESGAESWRGDSPQCAFADNISPAWLSLVNSGLEEVVKEQVLEIGVVAVSGSDIFEEDGTDDTTTTPHKGD